MEKFTAVFCQEVERWIARTPRYLFPFVLVFLTVNECKVLEGQKVKEYQSVLRQPVNSKTNQFEDERLCIHFSSSYKLISFTVQNKTQLPLKIIWDEVVFTNPQGETRRVLNSHVEYRSHGKLTEPAHHHIAPTEVPPGQTYTDYIRPFPIGMKDEFIYSVKDAEGSRFKLLLPVEINEHVNAYTFAFEVIEAPVPH